MSRGWSSFHMSQRRKIADRAAAHGLAENAVDPIAQRAVGRREDSDVVADPDVRGLVDQSRVPPHAAFGEHVAALAPEEIGVHLTEGDMMEPEAAVSALVVQHPDAKYFAV